MFEDPIMRRFEKEFDEKELAAYPEKDRDEMIKLAITRRKERGMIHWRIAWNAYKEDSNEPAGHKVLEVKTDGDVRENSPLPNAYQYRFSFRSSDSPTMKDWETIELGELGREDRGTLMSFAESWDFTGHGNCVTCVRETIERFIEHGGFKEEAKGVLQKIKTEIKKDREMDPRFNTVHLEAEAALRVKRTVFSDTEGDGRVSKLIDELNSA